MTTPRYNAHIVGQGLARLTSQFITQPNIRAWLAVLLRPWQELEDATWGVLYGRLLRYAKCYAWPLKNAAFDSLGALVGCSRQGSRDVEYRARIYLEAAVNRSTGRTVDWSRIARILLPWCTSMLYADGQAAVYFGAWNLRLPPVSTATQLSKVPGNGIGGVFAWTTWSTGNDFIPGSTYDGAAGQGGWGSVYDSTVGGVLVAGSEI